MDTCVVSNHTNVQWPPSLKMFFEVWLQPLEIWVLCKICYVEMHLILFCRVTLYNSDSVVELLEHAPPNLVKWELTVSSIWPGQVTPKTWKIVLATCPTSCLALIEWVQGLRAGLPATHHQCSIRHEGGPRDPRRKQRK